MKKITLVSMALVLAMGTLGVAYAMWSDTVTVDTNIATGSVDIAITGQAMLDEIASPPYYVAGPSTLWDYTCDDGFPGDPAFWRMGDKEGEIGKNVAWGECRYTADEITVTLHNTYPSNFNSATVYITNTGTIPVVIYKTAIWLGTDTSGTPYAELTPPEYVSLDFDGDGVDELEISVGDSFMTQVEPGDAHLEVSYWIHTLQEAEQTHAYTFTMKIFAKQYNE